MPPPPPSSPSPLARAAAPFRRAGRLVRDAAVRLLGPNGDLKALSLVLAALLFYAIRPNVSRTETFSVPVLVRTTNPLCTVVGVEPADVAVTLRGPIEDLARFSADDISITLVTENLDNIAAEDIDIAPGDIAGAPNSPLGRRRLRVVGVSPSRVQAVYDRLMRWAPTNFVATPRLVGTPLESNAEVVMPSNLVVSVLGEGELLKEFSGKGIKLPTASIDVEGRTKSFDTLVPIRIPADSGIISITPSNFLATVRITPAETALPGDATPEPTLVTGNEPDPVLAAATNAPIVLPTLLERIHSSTNAVADLLTDEERAERAAATNAPPAGKSDEPGEEPAPPDAEPDEEPATATPADEDDAP